ncbi:hypothetical protein [Kitasatospora sp. NPDC059571]|uniref:hypothetical protein n=1 Tax=Kitasatospora sp. NPDC059571 TaxID=3346871 RepID=UPI003682C373
METTKTITKLTGQTVLAMPSGALSLFGTRGTSTIAPRECGVAGMRGNGLGLNGTLALTVSGSGFTGLGGNSDETGLFGDWAIIGGGIELRDERPTQAPKAAVVAMHGEYAQVSGAGAVKKQDEQQIDQAEAALTGAGAFRMRAFRGPEPWSERT